MKADELRGCATRADAEAVIVGLAGSRLIGWDRTATAMIVSCQHHGTPGVEGIEVADSDLFDERYARWLGMPSYERAAFSVQPPYLMTVRPPDTGKTRFREAATVLREMADGPPTEKRRRTARANQGRGGGDYSTYKRPARPD